MLLSSICNRLLCWIAITTHWGQWRVFPVAVLAWTAAVSGVSPAACHSQQGYRCQLVGHLVLQATQIQCLIWPYSTGTLEPAFDQQTETVNRQQTETVKLELQVEPWQPIKR
jgi:hypothetical protein